MFMALPLISNAATDLMDGLEAQAAAQDALAAAISAGCEGPLEAALALAQGAPRTKSVPTNICT